nr:hypothetical protein Iba_chr04fCG11870 [Ipomoea batatas]
MCSGTGRARQWLPVDVNHEAERRQALPLFPARAVNGKEESRRQRKFTSSRRSLLRQTAKLRTFISDELGAPLPVICRRRVLFLPGASLSGSERRKHQACLPCFPGGVMTNPQRTSSSGASQRHAPLRRNARKQQRWL